MSQSFGPSAGGLCVFLVGDRATAASVAEHPQQPGISQAYVSLESSTTTEQAAMPRTTSESRSEILSDEPDRCWGMNCNCSVLTIVHLYPTTLLGLQNHRADLVD